MSVFVGLSQTKRATLGALSRMICLDTVTAPAPKHPHADNRAWSPGTSSPDPVIARTIPATTALSSGCSFV